MAEAACRRHGIEVLIDLPRFGASRTLRADCAYPFDEGVAGIENLADIDDHSIPTCPSETFNFKFTGTCYYISIKIDCHDQARALPISICPILGLHDLLDLREDLLCCEVVSSRQGRHIIRRPERAFECIALQLLMQDVDGVEI